MDKSLKQYAVKCLTKVNTFLLYLSIHSLHERTMYSKKDYLEYSINTTINDNHIIQNTSMCKVRSPSPFNLGICVCDSPSPQNISTILYDQNYHATGEVPN